MARLSRRSFVVGSGLTLATVPAVFAALESAPPVAAAPDATATDPYMFSLVGAADSPIPGGMVHRANKSAFPTLRGVAAFSLALDPRAIRQPHLHTNANELSYLVTGQARVGLVGPGGEQHLFDLAPGELAFQPMGWVHWLENTGDQPLFAVFMYSHEQPETIDLPDVLPDLPKQSGY
ncbi:MAG: cupin domain-containing protein [Thermomicrobia bacterium]|nr:cupin domain-containing protein [Thermomicrobia bacterium]